MYFVFGFVVFCLLQGLGFRVQGSSMIMALSQQETVAPASSPTMLRNYGFVQQYCPTPYRPKYLKK